MRRTSPKKEKSATTRKMSRKPMKPTESTKPAKLQAPAKSKIGKVAKQSAVFDEEHRKAQREHDEQQLASVVKELSSANEDAVTSALTKVRVITRYPELSAPIFWEHIPQLTVPQLVEICDLLKSQRETVQKAVLQFLSESRFDSDIVVPALLDAWSSLHPAQLSTAIRLIASCGTDSVSEALKKVVEGLLSNDINVRTAAGDCLWKHHDELAHALPALLANLREIKDEHSRDRAVLVTVKYFESINDLVECARKLLVAIDRVSLTASLRRLKSEGQSIRRLIDERDGFFPIGKLIENMTLADAARRMYPGRYKKDSHTKAAAQAMRRYKAKNPGCCRPGNHGRFDFDSAIFPESEGD
jgi:hypothetical protein